jgi:hypothetical protein
LKLCRFFEGSEDSKEAQLGSSLLECKVQFWENHLNSRATVGWWKGAKVFLLRTVELNQQRFAVLNSFF